MQGEGGRKGESCTNAREERRSADRETTKRGRGFAEEGKLPVDSLAFGFEGLVGGLLLSGPKSSHWTVAGTMNSTSHSPSNPSKSCENRFTPANRAKYAAPSRPIASASCL